MGNPVVTYRRDGNVGIITANHDPADLTRHLPGEDVVLGEQCWVGMNATILPGVHLGPHTVVGAGAVVKGTLEPNGVYAGVPARRIRDLESYREILLARDLGCKCMGYTDKKRFLLKKFRGEKPEDKS